MQGNLSSPGRLALVAIGFAVSGVAVVVALQGVDLEAAARIVRSAVLGWLALAVAVLGAQTLVRAERWRRLLPMGDRPRPPVRRIIPPLLVGYLGNTVLPARLGEPIRAGLVARREDLPFSATFGSVVLERVVDTLALAIVGAFAVAQVGLSSALALPVAIALLLGCAGLVVLVAAPGLLDRLHVGHLAVAGRFLVSLSRGAAVRGNGRAVGLALLLSGAAWLLDAGIYWCVARAIGLDLSFQVAILVSVVAALSTAIPAAPGYVGTFDVAIATTLGVLGVDPSTALAYAVCVHAVIVVPIVLAGGLSAILIARPGRSPELDEHAVPETLREPA